jgi:2-oxo-4-hydroxy-4-carboxy-5-ureidoimidazoline decarboxylase
MDDDVLARWNLLDTEAAARAILPCCGSRAWAQGVAARRPFADAEELFAASDVVWRGLPEDAWREAFDSHPRIGQSHARAATAESLAWSAEEQRSARSGAGSGTRSGGGSHEDAARLALAGRNRQYEERFGRIFIVCAAGKSAAEILETIERRMENSAEAEMLEAAEQQRQITQLRLRRWLGER